VDVSTGMVLVEGASGNTTDILTGLILLLSFGSSVSVAENPSLPKVVYPKKYASISKIATTTMMAMMLLRRDIYTMN
jgi:hypothetical protein